MDVEPFSSIVGGVASLAGSGIQYLTQKNYNRQARADYEKHAFQQFQYGQQAQRNAASNEVIGLRRAGLNPALLDNGNFQVANGGSAPMQQSSASAPDISGGIAALVNALTNRFNADTNKQNADTQLSAVESQNDLRAEQREALVRENAREDSYDSTINKNFDAIQKTLSSSDNELERVLGEALRKEMYGEDGERNDAEFDSGALRGYKDFLEAQASLQDSAKRILEGKMGQSVLAAQIRDEKVREVLVNMPVAQYSQLVALAQQAVSSIVLNGAKTEWTEQDLVKLQQEIANIGANTDLAKNKDWLTLFRNGDFLFGVARILGNAVSAGSDIAKGVAAKKK